MIDVVSRYGLDVTGGTDNAAKLAEVASDIAALYAAGKPLPRLVFTEGILAFSQWPDLAYANLQIVAEGECRLRGSVVFDGSRRDPGSVVPPNEPQVNNLTFTGFDVYGKTTFMGVHRSNLSVRTIGFGIEMVFCIVTKLHPVVSGSGRNPVGLTLSAWPGRANLQTTACTIDTPCLEGCSCGLYVVSAGNCYVHGGTIESCGTGVQIDTGGNNMFYSIDMEGNGLDVRALADAHNNGFVSCGTGGKLKTNFGLFSTNWAKS